jgi:phage-related protein
MARRYDLGSVVGNIKFTYDSDGTKRARDDMGRFVKETDGAGDHFDINGKKWNKFAKDLSSGAFKAGKSFVQLAGFMAAAAGSIQLLNGAVVAVAQLSQVAALLPGAFAALGAVIGTVALGVDGIKKAFEGLKPTMDNLKKAVSSSFESSLLPAVNNLKVLLPKLTSGFQQIATAIGGVATKFTAMLTQTRSVDALNNILGQTARIVQNVGKAAAPLGQAFLTIASIGASFITPMTAGLGALAEKFNAWVQSAQGQAAINDMIKTGVQAFKLLFQIIGQIGGIVVAVFDGLSTASGGFGQSLVDTLSAVREFLRSAEGFNALQAIGTALQTVGTAVRTVLLEALKQVAPIIPPLLKAFSDLAQQAVPPLVAILKVAGPILVKIAEALADNINWLGPLIIAVYAFSVAVGVLNAALLANPITLVVIALAALAAAVALVITNWDSIAAFFKGIWDKIWQWTSDRLTTIRDFIVKIWDGIVNWFSSLGSKIGSAFQSVIDWFTSLPGKIGTWLASLPGVIGNAFVTAFQRVNTALVQGLEWIIAWAISLPILMVRGLIALGGMLIDWFVSAWNGLIATTTTLLANLIHFFVALPGQIIDAVMAFGGMLDDWINNAWEFLTVTLVQRGQELINWFLGIPGRIIDAVIGFGASFAQWARDAWQGMVTAAANKYVEFSSWLRGLPARILSFFSNLGNNMVEIGKDIVRGIWNGIQNLASWLWNQVTGFVGGIVDKVKSILDIGSPSKVFADEVGRWIPAGIAAGIESSAGMIYDSLKSALDTGQMGINAQMSTTPPDMSSFLSTMAATQGAASPTVASTNSTTTGNVTIANLNIAGNLDPTNPPQWRQALVNIRDGIRSVERQYV